MAQVVSPAGSPTQLAQRTVDPSMKNPMSSGTIAAVVVSCVFVSGFVLAGLLHWHKERKKAKGVKVPGGGQEGDDPEAGMAMSESVAAGAPGAAAAVDRHASIRSIMTLPPYRPKPLDNEAVLGREGERDGIDTVVELPSVEEDEALREQEMDSLFQIRVVRQQQAEEREARRLARREARARNDEAALRAIREETANAATSNAEAIALLREEHSRVRETRARAGSSVNYAAVGVARNDGTRLRANSSESERVGLLSDAASMSTPGHQRGHSGSSVLTVDSGRSDSPSGLHQLRQVATATSVADGDALGDAHLPPHLPPGYDEVSLTDATPAALEPPPIYVPLSPSPSPSPPPLPPTTTTTTTTTDEAGPTEARNRRVSAHISDVAAEALRADTVTISVPRIVVDPSNATTANEGR